MLWKPGGACFQTTPILHNQHIRSSHSCPTRYLIHPAAPQRLGRICASKESVGPDGKARKSSFYKRPSKAIEMGGGFFIPGLEGYRLRLASALLVIVLLVLNRLPGYDPARSQVISEVIGVSAAVILLIQALVDKGIEDAVARAATRRPGSDFSDDPSPESGEYSALTDADADDHARWSGFALSEVVGAGAVVLLDRREGVVYSRSGAGRVGEKDRAAAVATDLINGLGNQKDVKRLEEVVDRQVLASIREGLQGLGDVLEGSLVVRVGEHRALVVAPRGKDQRIRKDNYVWIQQTAGLLAGSKQRVGAFTEP